MAKYPPATTTPGTFRPVRGPVRLASVISLVLCLALLIPVGGARAESGESGWSQAAGVDGRTYFVGQHRSSDGTVAYCTDFEKLAPPNADRYEIGGPGGFVRSDGQQLSDRENAALSYLLHRWGSTTDNSAAASVQLAVWALTSPGMAWGSDRMESFVASEQLPADIVREARSMTDSAHAQAGPYSVEIDLAASPDGGGVTAAVSVRGASGERVGGLKATASVTGHFSLPGQAESTWISSAEVHTVEVQRTGLGGGELVVSVPVTPAAAVNWLVPDDEGVQRLLTASMLEPRQAASSIAALPAFQPLVSTQTSTGQASAGEPLHDVLTVTVAGSSDAANNGWLSLPGSGQTVSVEVVSTLWGPLPSRPRPSDEVPAETPKLGTVTTRVDGPGTYRTPELTLPGPGWYVWTESIDPGSAEPESASGHVLPWQSPFGVVPETTLVPWSPSVSTLLSTPNALVGDSVTDLVEITGMGPPDQTVDNEPAVELTMYGPLPALPDLRDDVPEGATVHSQTTVPMSNGHHTSPPFAGFAEPGCYTVVASFAGDAQNSPYTSKFGEPSETVCVENPPAPPAEEPGPPPVEMPDAPPVEHPEKPAAAVNPADSTFQEKPPELAETGLKSELVTGSALVFLGLGLACVRMGNRWQRKLKAE
ncbi:hypothetical protein [Arthrobacter sp. H5]|uniref:hypothetical protein n=1 Tax=Arthrobacter sp. H5 TaxID=1267973 RepID=UPI0004800643|nr:hypothetical protein [Arthrobacter sp. H5]